VRGLEVSYVRGKGSRLGEGKRQWAK